MSVGGLWHHPPRFAPGNHAKRSYTGKQKHSKVKLPSVAVAPHVLVAIKKKWITPVTEYSSSGKMEAAHFESMSEVYASIQAWQLGTSLRCLSDTSVLRSWIMHCSIAYEEVSFFSTSQRAALVRSMQAHMFIARFICLSILQQFAKKIVSVSTVYAWRVHATNLYMNTLSVSGQVQSESSAVLDQALSFSIHKYLHEQPTEHVCRNDEWLYLRMTGSCINSLYKVFARYIENHCTLLSVWYEVKNSRIFAGFHEVLCFSDA